MNKLKLQISNGEKNYEFEYKELISELKTKEISVSIDTLDIGKLSLGRLLKLRYIDNDLEMICNDAQIIKFQIDQNDDKKTYVKFKFKSYTANKTSYKILNDTVEHLLYNTTTNFIALNLERQAGHTSTLLRLLNKHDDAILIVKSHELKQRALELISQYELYNIRKDNIIVVVDGVNLERLFEGIKFSEVFIDTYSLFSRTTIEKIIYFTKYKSGIRYICLG